MGVAVGRLGSFCGEDGGGSEQAEADERGEPDEILETEEATNEGGEVIPDAECGDGFDRGGGGGLGELACEVVISAEDHEGADGDGDDKADDLIPGAGGDEHGDGEEGACDEEGADVAGGDGAVIGVSKVIHSDDDGEGEEQGDECDYSGGEEFAEDGRPDGDGEGAEEFEGAVALFIRPEFHADGGCDEHVEPGVPEEEGVLEGGITDAHEVSEGEGHPHGEEQEDDDDGVCGGLCEVRFQLAF